MHNEKNFWVIQWKLVQQGPWEWNTLVVISNILLYQ